MSFVVEHRLELVTHRHAGIAAQQERARQPLIVRAFVLVNPVVDG
jgi:hypothetical protein